MSVKNDKFWMAETLELAKKGMGFVSPNPMVGCIILNEDGEIIGKGYHERYGKAHAEVNAIESVKNQADLLNATVYVSLEPCAHFGKTPPCADLLASLPLKKVVIAMEDPNPLVAGKGIQKLRDSGILVDVGILQTQAESLNESFLHFIKTRRPFITLKWAQTLDGYVAAADGSSQWITGKEARTLVHKWRSEYDAVLVGRNTALLDNPALTVRHVEGRQPKRIVLDGPGSLPKDLRLFCDQHEEKTIVVTTNPKHFEPIDPILAIMSGSAFRGTRIVVPQKENHVDLEIAFEKLGELGIASILVEAGSDLASALIKQNLIDKIECFIAPKLLGNGTRALKNLGVSRIQEAIEFRKTEWKQIGDDFLFTAYC